MIQKNFNEITKTDIDFLVDNKISEVKTLEYKEKLPGSQDSDKKEFLADISSFANASGGDVIYGIKEAKNKEGKKTGEPEKVVPIQGITADEAKLQIEELIRNGIEPRMPVQIKTFNGYSADHKGFVILIRIPQSFASPHMVKFKNTSRFYCRNSAGKYQLDVQEIRNAFLSTDSQAERIQNFLKDRLAKIMAKETPVSLAAENRLVLHILPLNSFLNNQRVQMHSYGNLTLDFRPLAVSSWDSRYNLDGMVTYNSDYENRKLNIGYCQLFFNGVVESVYSNILKTREGRTPKIGEPAFIASIAYERNIVYAIENYFKGYKALNIDSPAIVSMALLGCKGAYMWTDFLALDSHPIERDVAILPEVHFESFDEDIPTVMRPIFDAVWNACGHPRSFNYTQDGIWNVRLL